MREPCLGWLESCLSIGIHFLRAQITSHEDKKNLGLPKGVSNKASLHQILEFI